MARQLARRWPRGGEVPSTEDAREGGRPRALPTVMAFAQVYQADRTVPEGLARGRGRDGSTARRHSVPRPWVNVSPGVWRPRPCQHAFPAEQTTCRSLLSVSTFHPKPVQSSFQSKGLK